MNREAFLAELRSRLAGLPEADLEERLAFYGEMLDDRMEDGLTEAEAVASLGTPEEVAAQVLAEVPMSAILREKVRPKRRRGAGEITLLVLGSPIWLSLLIALFAVGLSLYVVLWAVVVSFWAVAVGLFAGAVGCVGLAALYLYRGEPGAAGFSAGAALICAGLALLWTGLCIALTKGTGKLSKSIWTGMKSRLARKENAE